MGLSKYNLNRAAGLLQEHDLQTRFSWDSTHKFYRCTFSNKYTGAVVHQGTSPSSEEAAFSDAANTINIEAIEAKPGVLAEENADLREKLRDLESKLEKPSAEIDPPAQDAPGDDEERAEPSRKKVRRRRTRTVQKDFEN